MSVIIIGGGEKLRAALKDLEHKSLTMTDAQRQHCEHILDQVTAMIESAPRHAGCP